VSGGNSSSEKVKEKKNKGIFLQRIDFTTDLHSMGQWIQEGERTIFETVISIKEPNYRVEIPYDSQNLDGLNYLAGKRVDEVNKMAELGTRIAHVEGGVPNILIEIPNWMRNPWVNLFTFLKKLVE